MFDSKIYIKSTYTAQVGGVDLHPRSASVDS